MTLGSGGCCRCQQWAFYADLRNQCQVFLQILSNWARKSYNNIEGSASETEANDMWSHPSAREMNSTFDDYFMPLDCFLLLASAFMWWNWFAPLCKSQPCMSLPKLYWLYRCHEIGVLMRVFKPWRSSKATHQGFVSLENQLLNISQSTSGLRPSSVSDPLLNCLGHFYFLVSKVPQRS